MAISRKRAALLRELEKIVGWECYNSHTQNWGPRGSRENDGRSIRYPITFTDEAGEKVKRKERYEDLSPDTQMTGCYRFGANELHIVEALDKVVQYLEKHHSLKI